MYYVYTDGACSGNRRGFGCVGGFGYAIVLNRQIIAHGSGSAENTTNNRMEMFGVITGLKKLKEEIKRHTRLTPKTQKCKILTDSKYICDNWNDYLSLWKSNGWRKTSGKPVINSDLWKQIDQITSEFESVEFEWVKGHAEDKFNTHVDSLCVKSMKQAILSKEKSVG